MNSTLAMCILLAFGVAFLLLNAYKRGCWRCIYYLMAFVVSVALVISVAVLGMTEK